MPFDPETASAFPDGSGAASSYLKDALARISRQRKDMDLLEQFISRHADRLAGSMWRLDLFPRFPEELPVIVFQWTAVRGEYPRTPAPLARLWEPAKWKVALAPYGNKRDDRRDWVTQIDGVELRIERAETAKTVVVTEGRTGSVVRL